MNEAVLAKNLIKEFGDIIVLDEVSFSLPKGGALGIAGPNGAGKTTLLKILFGLYPKSGGDAEVLGYRVGKDSHKIRQRAGYLPDKLPFSWERVKDLLRGFAYLQGNSFASARNLASVALTDFDMQEYGNKRYRQLSEGMKKRVLLALATVHNPDILFLDEPTANLDLAGRQEIEEMIKLQIKQGKTMLMVTHRARQIQRLCTHLIVLVHARIAFEGNPEEFIDRMNKEDMIIPNERLENVKIAPTDIDRLQIKSLGKYTVVPGEHWNDFLKASSIDPEKMGARPAPKDLGYSLAKCYAFGMEAEM